MILRNVLWLLASVVFVSNSYSAVPGDELPGPSKAKCSTRLFQAHTTVPATVLRVVDGDTINVKIADESYNIRMLSIDTPETHFMGRSQGYWGEKASDFLKDLLPAGTRVNLKIDAAPCDHFGRVLATVFEGKMNVHRKILEQGLAVNYCIYPNMKLCEEYSLVMRKIIKAKKGIFAENADVELPYVWRRQQRGGTWDKYVGNVHTYEVYSPEREDEIPVADRVYFMTPEHIQPPFRLVEEI